MPSAMSNPLDLSSKVWCAASFLFSELERDGVLLLRVPMTAL